MLVHTITDTISNALFKILTGWTIFSLFKKKKPFFFKTELLRGWQMFSVCSWRVLIIKTATWPTFSHWIFNPNPTEPCCSGDDRSPLSLSLVCRLFLSLLQVVVSGDNWDTLNLILLKGAWSGAFLGFCPGPALHSPLFNYTRVSNIDSKKEFVSYNNRRAIEQYAWGTYSWRNPRWLRLTKQSSLSRPKDVS